MLMSQPIVIAHHLIWTTYGSWLPNDPRGSGSACIRNDVLADLGELYAGRKKVQPPYDEVRSFYAQATKLLAHPVVTLDDADRAEVALAFAQAIAKEGLTCYACAIMPDHVHIIVRKHKLTAELIGEILQTASRDRLKDVGKRSWDHPTWCGGSVWKVFLEHPNEVLRTIGYVARNPIKAGMPAQNWTFVTPYDRWPLHPGHSPNSPYAKALRAAGRYP
jgi:REP element-mobilizing transposase RayT